MTVPHQTNLPVPERPDSPKVSILVAARNEATALPQTLESLYSQTWTNLEVIVVNDRSTDETKEVLEDAKKSWPDLRVLQIDRLPSGWLGKNYALYTASQVAVGDWLLFTDADVIFQPNAISATLAYIRESSSAPIEHLTLSPRLRARGFWLRSVVYLFMFNVIMVFRPQNAIFPKSPAFVGIGAFNLVQRNVYKNIGGHQRVALRPDEDLALGAAIKRAGFRQQFAGGTRLLTVEWYPSLREMTRGLEKNALAPFQYRMWKFTLGIFMFVLTYAGPALGLVFAPHFAKILFATTFVTELILFHLTRRYSGISTWWGFALPLATPILCYMLIRSAVLCLLRGGIEWRGTFYPLRDLRKGTRQTQTTN